MHLISDSDGLARRTFMCIPDMSGEYEVSSGELSMLNSMNINEL